MSTQQKANPSTVSKRWKVVSKGDRSAAEDKATLSWTNTFGSFSVEGSLLMEQLDDLDIFRVSYVGRRVCNNAFGGPRIIGSLVHGTIEFPVDVGVDGWYISPITKHRSFNDPKKRVKKFTVCFEGSSASGVSEVKFAAPVMSKSKTEMDDMHAAVMYADGVRRGVAS